MTRVLKLWVTDLKRGGDKKSGVTARPGLLAVEEVGEQSRVPVCKLSSGDAGASLSVPEPRQSGLELARPTPLCLPEAGVRKPTPLACLWPVLLRFSVPKTALPDF